MPTLIKPRKRPISWTPSTDGSAVGQTVYVKFGDQLMADDPPMITDLPMDTNKLIAPDDFPEGTFDQEGTYVIGIGTVDSMGNEAIEWLSAPLDFIAPSPATGLVIS